MSNRFCAKCSVENNETAKFCAGCGEQLSPVSVSAAEPPKVATCAQCGTQNAPTAKFCKQCGYDLLQAIDIPAAAEENRPGPLLEPRPAEIASKPASAPAARAVSVAAQAAAVASVR